MNDNCGRMTKNRARSIDRLTAFKQSGRCLAAVALMAGLLALHAAGGTPGAGTSTVVDPAGDAVFPYDLYHAPVPNFLDVVEASVSFARGVFHFEIKVNSDIPADADPGFNPPVNHMGATFGVNTDQDAKGPPRKFLGQSDVYYFNFLVGALYSVTDSGAGLQLGWTGFIISPTGLTEIPVKIKQDTFILEVDAAVLGNPTSFEWAVASECDPVKLNEEDLRTTILVDYAPNHGVTIWPPLPVGD